jgi:hypothetical protein
MKSVSEILLFGLIILMVVYIILTKGKQEIIVVPSASAKPSSTVVIQEGGDDRYTRAPRPQRFWNTRLEYPTRGALDPIPTRGPPEEYQQMGVLSGPDGKVLPLFGRRVAARSEYFNYYTRTDTYNPVALPLTFKKRDCQDNVGCAEVFNGDTVRMVPTGEEAKVTLYGFDGPRYS